MSSDYAIINDKEEFEEFWYYDATKYKPSKYPKRYPCLGTMSYQDGGLGGGGYNHYLYYPPEGVDIETFRACLDAGPPPPDDW